MSVATANSLRRKLTPGALVLAVGTLLCVGLSDQQSVLGQSASEPVVRVEEDWELALNDPNSSMDAPQFHTMMSAFGNCDRSYAQVLWNYRETPSYTAGGVQLQSYSGESKLSTRSMEFRKLNTSAETITWTQSLSTDGTTLSFEVSNGQSNTWGVFGKDMRLDDNADLSDLSGYSSEFSTKQSGVTYGSNRVDKLVIKEVRRYGASGLLSVDSTPKVVFELNASN